MNPVEWWTLVFLAAGIIPLALTIFYYGTDPVPGTHWRRPSRRFMANPFGIVFLLQKFAMLAIFTFIFSVRLIGDYPGREWVALALYGVLEVMFWAVFIVVRRIQIVAERKKAEEARHV